METRSQMSEWSIQLTFWNRCSSTAGTTRSCRYGTETARSGRFMKVVCCQFNVAWEDKLANYAKVRSMLEASKIPAGSLVVLPEMFSTGFSMNVSAIREESPSKTESFLSACAQDFEVFVLAGLVTAAADGRGR